MIYTLLLKTMSPSPPHQPTSWIRPWPDAFPSDLLYINISDDHCLRVDRDYFGRLIGSCRLKNLKQVHANIGWEEEMTITLLPSFYVPPEVKLEPYQIEYLVGLARELEATGWEQKF